VALAFLRHAPPDGNPLVHQCREPHPPTGADLTQALRVGQPHLGQVHLVELRVAGHLEEGPDLDSRCRHVHDEGSEACVLGQLRIGPCQQQAPAGNVRPARPHLLPVDHPLVAVPASGRGHRGQVATSPGLAEELAPDLFTREQRSQVALHLGRAPVVVDRRGDHPNTQRISVERLGHAPGAQSRIDLGLSGRRKASPTRALTKMDPRQPAVELLAEHDRRVSPNRVEAIEQPADELVDRGPWIEILIITILAKLPTLRHAALPSRYNSVITSATTTERRPLRRPPLYLLAAEQAPMFEYSAYLAATPYLRLLPRGDAHPVFVLPGFTADDSSTRLLRRFLRERGNWSHGWRLGPNIGPTARILGGMRARLQALHRLHGRRVTLLGWSLGGVYARELAREAPSCVRQVITMGSPFRLNPSDRTVVSDLWDRLSEHHVEPPEWWHEEQRPLLTVPATAIYTRNDGMVPWESCLEVEGPFRESIEVYGTHSGLGFNPTVLFALADRLAQPEGEWRPFRPPSWARGLFPAPAHWRPGPADG
jgi:pimeloyl-ACP methyl ester carboxylesterase